MPKPASNNQIKEWRKLLMGKYRKKKRLFLAEGVRCVEQILQNGVIRVNEILSDTGEAAKILPVPPDLPVYELSRDDFISISDTETPQGVIAVCRMPEDIAADAISNREGVIVALDAIRDPGNLGTIIRTAGWFDVKAILFGTGCVDPFHPKVVRSTAGATGTIPFLKGDLERILPSFEQSGWQTLLLEGSDEAADIQILRPHKKSILVAGNEANGIRGSLFSTNRLSVRIKGYSRAVESLNVAVALGIGIFSMSSPPPES